MKSWSNIMMTLLWWTHRVLSKIGPGSGLFFYHFYRQPLQASPEQSNSANIFQWLNAYSPLLEQLPRPQSALQQRFVQQAECLLAVRDGEVTACAWFGFNQFDEDEVRCRFLLPTDAVWDFDIYVIPKYRIGRLFVRTWNRAGQDLLARGYSSSLSRISAFNPNSIRSHEKMGAKRIASGIFMRIGPLQLMAANMAPYAHISFTGRGPHLNFADRA